AVGPLGREIVVAGLRRGHDVTGYSGDPTDRLAVGDAVAGRDAVIYAVTPSGGRRRDGVVAAGALATVRAMSDLRVRRLICVSAAGISAQADPGGSWWYERVVKPLLRPGAAAELRQMEVTVRQSGLEWTIVRPARLVEGPAQHSWRAGPGYGVPHGTKIAYADAAAFVVAQLDDDRDVGHAVAVAW
ncbi:MAG TPA: NAD(P)H-binding protein, partial [Thermoleophilia bacterium]|nr:NAD(P)H-binding protein [Thermoleophilia bacterium]